MHFILNGKFVKAKAFSGETTLLQFIRDEQQLSGTKEGCASGDCGACTVMIGENRAGAWQYEAVNSCITLLAQVHGKQIVTVEGLRTGAALHPVQSAMIEHHASQCGFCTPGIVMSLSALLASKQQQHSAIDDADIYDALSGNLCRCTGYRPIVDAARELNSHCKQEAGAMIHYWHPDNASSGQAAIDTASDDLELIPGVFAPRSEAELLNVLSSHPKARLVAGATDLALEATQQYAVFKNLIMLDRVTELKQLQQDASYLYLGASVSYSESEPLLAELFPEFYQLMHRLGSRQIRNKGTFGGNIANASPIGDTPPVLIALGAEIELASPSGRRWLPIHNFFIAYKKTQLQEGEYLRQIRIPLLQEDEHLKVYKISKRLEDDISAALMALKLKITDNKVIEIKSGFGGLDAIPRASHALEEALLGCTISEQHFYAAGEVLLEDFRPLSDVRASAEYRVGVCRDLLRKCALELLEPNVPEALTRVERLHSLTNNAGKQGGTTNA